MFSHFGAHGIHSTESHMGAVSNCQLKWAYVNGIELYETHRLCPQNRPTNRPTNQPIKQQKETDKN